MGQWIVFHDHINKRWKTIHSYGYIIWNSFHVSTVKFKKTQKYVLHSIYFHDIGGVHSMYQGVYVRRIKRIKSGFHSNQI